MSSRIFQGVIVQMKDATTRCIGVVDEQGFVIACSELSMIGSRLDDFQAAVGEVQEQLFATDTRTYKILSASTARFEYAVFVEGNDQTARSICILAAVGMTEASTNFEEKHNKAAFVKNIISDNILPGDVYVRAKELHFTTDVPRAVLLVRQVNVTDIAVLELIQNMFPDRQHDFVLSVSESDIVVIKEMTPDETSEDICALAESIEHAVHTELRVQTVKQHGSRRAAYKRGQYKARGALAVPYAESCIGYRRYCRHRQHDRKRRGVYVPRRCFAAVGKDMCRRADYYHTAAGAEQTVYKACRDPREREQKRAFARCRRYEKARRQRAAVRGLFF